MPFLGDKRGYGVQLSDSAPLTVKFASPEVQVNILAIFFVITVLIGSYPSFPYTVVWSVCWPEGGRC